MRALRGIRILGDDLAVEQMNGLQYSIVKVTPDPKIDYSIMLSPQANPGFSIKDYLGKALPDSLKK